MAFTPDGGRVIVVSVKTGDLVVIDANSRKEQKRIKIGRGAGILVDPDGSRVLVSCTPDNYIAVVDLSTLEMTKKLEIGGRPDGLAWAIRH